MYGQAVLVDATLGTRGAKTAREAEVEVDMLVRLLIMVLAALVALVLVTSW
jgi:hypothetical protein